MADYFFDKLLARPSVIIARLLFELADHLTSKSVHKGIKRTLYRLKQRGMDIPSVREDKGEKAGHGILKETVSAQVSGYLSEFDELRNRVLAPLFPRFPKAKLFIFALIDPENSLESLTALAVIERRQEVAAGSSKNRPGILFYPQTPAGGSYFKGGP